MKITRRQIRKLIEKVTVVAVSDEDKAAIEKETGDVEAAKEKLATKLAAQQGDSTDKPSKEDIKKALSEAAKKSKEISIKQVNRAIISCLKREGGAAGLGMLVDVVTSLETKTKNLPEKLSSKAKIKKYITKHPGLLTHKYKDIILVQGLPRRK